MKHNLGTVVHEEYRRDSYKLLSDCYYLPDEKLVETLSGLDESRDWLNSEIAKTIPGIDDVVSLQIDYSKLFVGPFGLLAPPYGSVYLENDGLAMGDTTMDAKNWYEEAGLNIGINEVPDHIAIELEFMYFLIFKEAEAEANSDTRLAAGYKKKQEIFLKTHLGRWAKEFTDKIEANAETEFYKNLARITKSFLLKDIKSLSANCGVALA